ncbi:MAG: 30S ribosomal protein S3 [Promethearchaeota archaeon]
MEQGIKLTTIDELLRAELMRAGFAGIDLQKTPLGTRIVLKTSRPGLVIGKGGKRIQEITDLLNEKFDMDMLQIEVEEVKKPDLDAQIMAERLAYSLDRGRHYRRAGYYILRKVMDAGARGVEIIISGKITSQRARTQIFRAGTMSKSGQIAQEGVDKGVAQCIQKSGVLGIIVKIMKSDVKFGDDVKIKKDLLEKAQKEAEARKKKTEAEKVMEKEYEITEEEGVLSEEDAALLDEVDMDDVSEMSVDSDSKNETKNNS